MIIRKHGIAAFAIIAAAATIGPSPAQAYTFTFDDTKYVSCSNFRCTDGAANFAAAFPGYSGGPGYSRPGFYQVITTSNGQTWSGLNGTNPTPTYIANTSSAISGEFIQNDPNNLPVQFTEGQDKLVLDGSGWTSTGGTTTGALVNSVIGKFVLL